MARGLFITLEGGEGAGKSTQAKLLADYLRGLGHDVVLTREVGGCPSAEKIREFWLGAAEGEWSPVTELMLINAARREHLVQLIWPALEKGQIVISDRFADSTRAYQGIGLGVDSKLIEQMHQTATHGGKAEPDLTFLLDLPVETGMSRVASRQGVDDRYEQKPTVFHLKLRDAYLALAGKYPERIKRINAAQDAAQVAASMQAAMKDFLARK